MELQPTLATSVHKVRKMGIKIPGTGDRSVPGDAVVFIFLTAPQLADYLAYCLTTYDEQLQSKLE